MKWLKGDSYTISILLALGLHTIVIFAGLIAVDFNDSSINEPSKPVIVNATVVDISQTIIGKRESEEKAAKQRQISAEKEKRVAQEKRKKEAQQKALENKRKKLAEANRIKEKAAEAAAKAEQKKQQEAKQKRLAENAEQKRLAEEAKIKQKAADEQKRKEQAQKVAAERKRKEQVQEAERLAEQERQRQKEIAKQTEQRNKAVAAARAAAEAENKRAEAEAEAKMVQSISGLINSRVTAAWTRPPSARNGMKTELAIYFLPNGEVMDVQITKGSGDGLFDQKAVDAVYKVRRIEELADVDSYIFERNFRQIDLIFNPQDLRN